MKFRTLAALTSALLLFPLVTTAEDGYQLWLRYAPLDSGSARTVSSIVKNVYCPRSSSPTRQLAQQELETGFSRLLSKSVNCSDKLSHGSVVLAKPGDFDLDLSANDLGEQGYRVQTHKLQNRNVVLIAANDDIGLLYGAFALLKHVQVDQQPATINLTSSPKIQHRLLNHWDNLDGHVERGYAGKSIWDWWRLPEYVNTRYRDYARVNASIGINGTVLNNVNSNALILTPRYLEKVAAIADVMRPWGIRVYLSARFSAPQEIGGLTTSDPLNADVQMWWKNKVDEIYRYVPDFGGFLVKANSEGQPGPQDFGRTHADGANLLARALAPHDGIVMWRAFVYSDVNPEDRAKQAYSEFKPLDGKFEGNVIIQVKNGAIDFQPREPFHPMFGAFPKTPLMMEFQITKEYLGFATHLAYLGPMYQEVLKADTHAHGEDSLVAKVIDGSLHNHALTAMAGVANIGADRDWSGSDFNQANWYVFGRMAWDPMISAEAAAEEWLAQTFSREPKFIDTATHLMMRSREAVVDYMTPLGLAHLMGTGHHYGPAPWVSELGRPEWNPVYYHRANKDGIGFDRTASGSDALTQYSDTVAEQFADANSIEKEFLLWFHHVPWDFKMQSGQTLWQELVQHYDRGIAEVAAMQQQWQSLESFVDAERFAKASQMLEIQHKEAIWWRDACLTYFMSISGLSIPEGTRPPEHNLEYYKSLTFPNAPGNG